MTARQLLIVLACIPDELRDLHFECELQDEHYIAGSLVLMDNRGGAAVLRLDIATTSKDRSVIYSEGWEGDLPALALLTRGK